MKGQYQEGQVSIQRKYCLMYSRYFKFLLTLNFFVKVILLKFLCFKVFTLTYTKTINVIFDRIFNVHKHCFCSIGNLALFNFLKFSNENQCIAYFILYIIF